MTQLRIPTKLSLSSSFTPKPDIKSHSHLTFPARPFPFKLLCSSSSQNQSPFKTLNVISLLGAISDWADSIKERGMRNRSLYNHEKWVEHRSSLRHLTAPALALLLVFRTEASYSRFEEGRKAWTKVIAGTNDFARQVLAGVDSSGDNSIKAVLLRYIMAFPVALKCHLVYGSDIGRDLEGLLEVDDLAIVVHSKHRPRCIIEFISQSLQLLNLEESKRNMLESNISCFHEGLGVCEQLMGIPIPLSYTRLTSRFLVLWHLTLPIILWDDCHWIVVPATFISAASLFCIEEVGVLIEEPFPMLALDDLCNLAHDNIQEAIATQKTIRSQLLAKKMHHSCEHSPNGCPNS